MLIIIQTKCISIYTFVYELRAIWFFVNLLSKNHSLGLVYL